MNRPYQTENGARNSRQRKRRNMLLLSASLVLVCLVAVIVIAGMRSNGRKAEGEMLSAGLSTQPPTGLAVAPPSWEQASLTSTQRVTALQTTEGASESGTTPAKGNNAYFQDAVFIGDSRTEGLGNSGLLSGATFYAYKGLMVDTVFTKPVISDGGQKLTVIDALKKHSFGKVYIMLGVNELGWANEKAFINGYGKLVDAIKNIESGTHIYVQSILPVSREKSAQGVYTNDRIRLYNRLLKEMCAQKGVQYLDVYQAVVDGSGNLPADASADGVHLKMAYCRKWADYLRAHTDA